MASKRKATSNRRERGILYCCLTSLNCLLEQQLTYFVFHSCLIVASAGFWPTLLFRFIFLFFLLFFFSPSYLHRSWEHARASRHTAAQLAALGSYLKGEEENKRRRRRRRDKSAVQECCPTLRTQNEAIHFKNHSGIGHGRT